MPRAKANKRQQMEQETAVSGLREYFFQLARNPVSCSNLVAALAAGTVLQVDRLPAELLPAVMLLAHAAMHAFGQQIVDSWHALLRRTAATMQQTDVTCRLPTGECLQHINMNAVSGILNEGEQCDYFLGDLPETRYIEQLYLELAGAEPEQLFAELEKEAKVL